MPIFYKLSLFSAHPPIFRVSGFSALKLVDIIAKATDINRNEWWILQTKDQGAANGGFQTVVRVSSGDQRRGLPLITSNSAPFASILHHFNLQPRFGNHYLQSHGQRTAEKRSSNIWQMPDKLGDLHGQNWRIPLTRPSGSRATLDLARCMSFATKTRSDEVGRS